MKGKKVLSIILLSIILLMSGSRVAYALVGANCNSTTPCGLGEYCRCGICETACSGTLCINNPLCANSFQDLIESLIDFIFWLAVVICPLMIIIGAFYYVTSGGNPEKMRTARNIILYAVIGFAIVLLAEGIISLVENIMEG